MSMVIIAFMSLMLCVFLVLSKTPIQIIFLIIMQNMVFIVASAYKKMSFWPIIFVILIFLGGVMIIFLYINSSSNQSYSDSTNLNKYLIASAFMLMFFPLAASIMMNQNFLMQLLTSSFFFYKEIFSLAMMVIVTLFIFNVNKVLKSVKAPLSKSL